MSNMDCSRIQNTKHDMRGCLEALQEGKKLSWDEASAGRWMFDEILGFCMEEGIIDTYNGEVLRTAFMRRIGENEGDE